MTNRERILCAYHGGTPDSVPCFFSDAQINVADSLMDSPPIGTQEGYDGYGVYQIATQSAGGMFTPSSNHPHAISDITKWKEEAVFPDYSKTDWNAVYEGTKQAMHWDRERFVQDFFCPNGIFERLHFCLGFEEAMVAIMTEPEAVYEYVGAVADKKIEAIQIIDKYFAPDVFTYLDDYAHIRGLFISPQTFRDIFKPHIKRIVNAVKNTKMMFKQHCCGKMESLLDDFYDIGIRAFDPGQPINDLSAMKNKYPGEISIMGGLDVQHVIDRDGVTEEELRKEVWRCIDSYAPGGGYIMYGTSVQIYNPESYAPGGRLGIIIDECMKYGHSFYSA
jgi:hypothetical protein